MSKMDEKILAIPRKEIQDTLERILQQNGFLPFTDPNEYNALLTHAITDIRGNLETNELFKQLIPYLVIRSAGKILYYVRASGGSESRLHDKVSIGIGGHIEMEDISSVDETIKAALQREVVEEIGDIELTKLTPLGYIYTDQGEVDKVHLGLLFRADIENDDFTIEDSEIKDLNFATVEELNAMLSNLVNFENWTRIVLLNAADKLLES